MQPIQTPRLNIRAFVEEDLDAVVRLHDDCFGEASRAARELWLQWSIRNHQVLEELRQPPYGDYAVALNDGGAVIGAVGLVPSFGPFEKLPWFRTRLSVSPDDLFTPEMGLFWGIAAPHRGSGYATEAAGALAQFAFDTLRAQRLVATTEHANTASIAVMRKLGMIIQTNPDGQPHWFQAVGILVNPATQ